MANKVERYSIAVADKAGEGARVLGALAAGKANLSAAWGYPVGDGNARVEVIPVDSVKLKAAAKAAKIKLKKECAAFYVEGRNKVGVVAASLAALADKVFVAYAAPGGKTESFCKRILEWGKPLLTFDAPDNDALLALGAQPVRSVASITGRDVE